MAKSVAYAVFLIPIILSIIFGSSVLAQVLQEPDRELNMLPFDLSKDQSSFSSKSLQIIGLQSQYSVNTPVSIEIEILDSKFDCGDMYITIYETKPQRKSVTQSGYFEQCFKKSNSLVPVDDDFSETIDKPGTYEIVVEVLDANQQSSISAKAEFIVK